MGHLGYVKDEIYHTPLVEGLSRSSFLNKAKSPKAFSIEQIIKKAEALIFGNLVHCLVNEPKELYKAFAFEPPLPKGVKNLTTIAGKAFKKEVLEPFRVLNKNKSIIKPKDAKLATSMCNELFKYKAFKYYDRGEKEHAFQGQIKGFEIEEGYKIKCDSIIIDECVFFDLKTIANIEDVEKDSKYRDYDVQFWFYQQVLFDVYGVKFRPCAVYVEKKLNPDIRFIEYSDEYLEFGRYKFEKYFNSYLKNKSVKDNYYKKGWDLL